MSEDVHLDCPRGRIKSITALGVEIIEGPVNRAGVAGEIESIYFRDSLFYKLDGNLIELANYK